MKMKRWIVFAAIFSYCSAQQPDGSLRLSDCIDQALQKNPAIHISQAKRDAARARTSEVAAALLPQLKLTGRAARLSPVDPFGLNIQTNMFSYSGVLFPSITENYSVKLTLQQPLFTGWKLLKGREMASLNEKATGEELTKDQSELILAVTAAYWNVYRARKIEEVVSQSVEQAGEHVKDAINLSRQGLATDADVMKVQVQHSEMKVKYIEARNAVRIASMMLNTLLDRSIEQPVALSDTPGVTGGTDIPLLQENLPVLKVRGLDRRPELKSMKLRSEMNAAGITAARGGWYPQIFLVANYDYARPNQRVLPPKDRWDAAWDVGIQVQWNLWDWMTVYHQTAQAEAMVRQTEAGAVQLHNAIQLEVAQNYFDAQTAKEKIEVAAGGIKQAAESHRMTSEKFKNGAASNTELIDAENALLQAKLTYTNAVVDCTVAIARLKKAIGENP